HVPRLDRTVSFSRPSYLEFVFGNIIQTLHRTAESLRCLSILKSLLFSFCFFLFLGEEFLDKFLCSIKEFPGYGMIFPQPVSILVNDLLSTGLQIIDSIASQFAK